MGQRVSVIGLGRMGSALATTLLEDHYKVTVWNRTAAKAEPLVEAGATLAASVNEAIDGSEEAWRSGERPIMCLGGSSKYVGTNLAATIVLEEALVVPLLMATMGTIHGAHILEQAGFEVGLYADMLSGVISVLTKSLPREVAAIAANDFTNTEASIEAWGVGGYDHTEELPTGAIDLLEPIRELLNQAVAAGYGDEGSPDSLKRCRALRRQGNQEQTRAALSRPIHPHPRSRVLSLRHRDA